MVSSSSCHLPALRGGRAVRRQHATRPAFGVGIGRFSTASLLCSEAALIGALLRRPVDSKGRARASDTRRLTLMALFGAVVGPVALAWGCNAPAAWVPG